MCLCMGVSCCVMKCIKKHTPVQPLPHFPLPSPPLPSPPPVQVLHYVEEQALPILRSPQFLSLSERMVHLIIERDLQAEEIVKVRAILDWGERNFAAGECVCARVCVCMCVCVCWRACVHHPPL